MPKSPPPFLNSRYLDVFLKLTSRLNTWMYRRNNGEGLGGTFQNIPTCAKLKPAGCVIAYSSWLANETPPATTFFGIPDRGVSFLSGLPTKDGTHVVCTNPANLNGGVGALVPLFGAAGSPTRRARTTGCTWSTSTSRSATSSPTRPSRPRRGGRLTRRRSRSRSTSTRSITRPRVTADRGSSACNSRDCGQTKLVMVSATAPDPR